MNWLVKKNENMKYTRLRRKLKTRCLNLLQVLWAVKYDITTGSLKKHFQSIIEISFQYFKFLLSYY